MPYVAHNIAKIAGSHLISGGGDAASAIVAEAKAAALQDLLQEYYQDPHYEFDGSDIDQTDVKKAIAYVRGKKHTKAIRKGVIATTKFGLQVAATVGGATVGSIVPVAGTALGGLGGAIAGAGLGTGVTVLDRMKRSTKGIYKYLKGTRGQHREQAANTLMHCASALYNWADGRNPADDALVIILQDEYDDVMAKGDVKRLAARLKSN
ncbi:hypothetical protein [Falsiroseomonas sp. HW251]|uniref:hypothetical protein n=1 Tax=Falsiroseomonas sp. HW251 TaxID=3390998 RepID=UPI003D315758